MRYTIEGKRPGVTIHAAGRFVRWDDDGGYAFTDAESADLRKRGYKLEKVKPGTVVALSAPTATRQIAKVEAYAQRESVRAGAEVIAAKSKTAPAKPDPQDERD